jgi:hypothetical protein
MMVNEAFAGESHVLTPLTLLATIRQLMVQWCIAGLRQHQQTWRGPLSGGVCACVAYVLLQAACSFYRHLRAPLCQSDPGGMSSYNQKMWRVLHWHVVVGMCC